VSQACQWPYGGTSMKSIKKTNPRILQLIADLKTKSREQNVDIWKDIAQRLGKPTKHYAEINLSKISRFSNDNETVIVPGKVLGTGDLTHPVTVAALNFSLTAEVLIAEAEGKCLSIEQLMETNPTGKGVRILK
jgi:large subunit ribosomal protein L18e